VLRAGDIVTFYKEEWDAIGDPKFPFADYDYLRALEDSGVVSRETGWTPVHLGVEYDGRLVGASPLYLKRHSYGEYIFDWEWANAYQAHGLKYFPKLVSAIPYTPATGPKLLGKGGGSEILAAAKKLTENRDASSLHYLFLSPGEIPTFENAGFLIRHSFQYHWFNEGYASFEDFLGRLKSRKRKQIVKERRGVAVANLHIELIPGSELTVAHADTFFDFYTSTIEKMGANRYLNLDFFRRVFATLGDRVFLIQARLGKEPIAGALFYQKGESLFGRYWGCRVEIPYLHFELCYYRAIDYAIKNKLRLFEAGAQGEHKFARGFIPQLNYSAHWLRHAEFSAAIARFIDVEKRSIDDYFKQLRDETPYHAVPAG